MTPRTPNTPGRPETPRGNSASDAGEGDLLRRAREALAQAYSPYSKVRVGAALRARDGRIFTGCNVENASFGLTCCAERTALVKAVSEGAREFDAIAIASDAKRALMPCGACRQMLSEFAPNLRVLVAGVPAVHGGTAVADVVSVPGVAGGTAMADAPAVADVPGIADIDRTKVAAGTWRESSLDKLLPDAFGPSDLR